MRHDDLWEGQCLLLEKQMQLEKVDKIWAHDLFLSFESKAANGFPCHA